MDSRLVPVPRNSSPIFWINLAVKAVLIGLLVFGAFSGLQQFEGKGYLWRLATYPIAALVVPVAWRILGQRPLYPYATDLLLTLPFLVDTAGNALDLYDTIVWWDDANTLPTGRCSPAPLAPWPGDIVSAAGKLWRTWWDSAPSPPSCGRSVSISPSFELLPSSTRPIPTH